MLGTELDGCRGKVRKSFAGVINLMERLEQHSGPLGVTSMSTVKAGLYPSKAGYRTASTVRYHGPLGVTSIDSTHACNSQRPMYGTHHHGKLIDLCDQRKKVEPMNFIGETLATCLFTS